MERIPELIPLCDLKQQYQALKSEIDHAMQQVATDAAYILGPNVKALEKEIAEYCGAQFAVGVGSGTDALHLALRALQVGPGDEVITTPFTFIGTTEAICIVGANPVFVDIDPHTFNIDVDQIEAAITPRTKAILPVHLYGQPCEMKPIVEIANRYELHLVEDCAQSIGASYQGKKVGTFGNAGCFSFFPSKNLGCFGDGGMIVTNDEEVYQRAEMLRRHGGKVKYRHTELGLNSRLDELQAAILRVKLKYLDEWSAQRRLHAYRYNSLLGEMSEIQCPVELSGHGMSVPRADDENELIQSVYHQYTIQTEDREVLQQRLKEAEIGSAVYYPVPLHLQQVHQNLCYKQGDFPSAELVSQRCLSLPMFPELTEGLIEEVCSCLSTIKALLPENAFAIK